MSTAIATQSKVRSISIAEWYPKQHKIAAKDADVTLCKHTFNVPQVDKKNLQTSDLFQYVDAASVFNLLAGLSYPEKRQEVLDGINHIGKFYDAFGTTNGIGEVHYEGLEKWQFDALFKAVLFAVSVMEQEGKYTEIEISTNDQDIETAFHLIEHGREGEVLQRVSFEL